MTYGTPQSAIRTGSLLFSLLFHILLLAVLFSFSRFQVTKREKPRTEVRFVHLRGGGENRPGWVKPTLAAPDKALVSDGKPKSVRRVKPPPETALQREETGVEEKPPPAPLQAVTADRAEMKDTVGYQGADASRELVSTEESQGVGAKPGPEGPGLGARSDADFPGGELYLSRIEVEVQRRFNFRDRGSGLYAEYHFFIDRNGKIRDLVLVASSGIASLDLSARSALMRSRFAPLPTTYTHDRLGVTYRFYDAD